jgi:hypothetical protein
MFSMLFFAFAARVFASVSASAAFAAFSVTDKDAVVDCAVTEVDTPENLAESCTLS